MNADDSPYNLSIEERFRKLQDVSAALGSDYGLGVIAELRQNDFHQAASFLEDAVVLLHLEDLGEWDEAPSMVKMPESADTPAAWAVVSPNFYISGVYPNEAQANLRCAALKNLPGIVVKPLYWDRAEVAEETLSGTRWCAQCVLNGSGKFDVTAGNACPNPKCVTHRSERD